MAAAAGGGGGGSAKLVTQRDINCLSDPDRNTRKRALEKIVKALGELAKDRANFTPSEAQEALTTLHSLLLKLFKDSAEKCRELAVTIIASFAPLCDDVGVFVDATVKAVRERIGDSPVLEESEEVRLALVSLTHQLVTLSPSSAKLCVADLCSITEKSCLDKFPDAKKVAADLAVLLSKTVREESREFSAAVCKALASNLSHQQYRTRVAALHGLGALVPCGDAKVFDDMMPFVARLNLDRAHQVREAVLHVAASWMVDMPPTVIPKLLPVLLHGVSDDLDAVRGTCVELVDKIGRAQAAGGEGGGAEEGVSDKVAGMYPLAFARKRPCGGARALVKAHLDGMLPSLFQELTDWTPSTRGRGAATLLALLVYAEGEVARHAEALVGAFAKAYMDDDEHVASRVAECVCLAGAFVPAQVFVGVIGSNISNTTLAAASKRNWIAVLAALLEGATEEDIAPLLPQVCEMVGEMELCMPEEEEHQVHLLRVLLACVSSGGKSCWGVSGQLFASLLRLQALHYVGMNALSAGAADGIQRLAAALGLEGGGKELFEREAGGVLAGAMGTKGEWRRDSKDLQVFDTLLRSGGEAVVPFLDLCMPAFSIVADTNRDADVRSSLLVLLDFLLAESGVQHHMDRFGASLLADVIVPVCVWRAGKVASALRKAGVSCMKHLMAQRLVKATDVMKSLGEGFAAGPLDPVIKSCMDDDDADIRFIACGAAREMFAIVAEMLDTEQVRHFYLEVLKRLDDSNDTIRCEVASAAKAFMASVPIGYDPSQYEYLLRNLVVHLDDQNDLVQQAVLPAVLAAAPVNPALFTTVVKDCKGKHRSGKLCQEALDHVAKLQQGSNEVLE